MILILMALAACDAEPRPTRGVTVVAGGNAEAGRQALRAHGCVACHRVPGVVGVKGRVGPSLDGWANRQVVAGVVPNTPDHLIAFIREPQSLRPGSAMPDLGVDERDARNMAAYLFTLR